MFGIFDTLRRLTASLTRTADLVDAANDRLSHLLSCEQPVDVTPPLPPPVQAEANGHTEEPVTAGTRKRGK